MIRKKTFFIVLISILCLLLLTGCEVEQSLDSSWLERAHAPIPVDDIAPNFEWIILLAIPCMVFGGLAVVRQDWTSFAHWMAIMVLGVGSFLRIADVIQVVGDLFWPENYTISNVANWMGWTVPFPEDASYTSKFAYAFTDSIPSIYNMWQWVLLFVHAIALVTVTFSRSLKPIVVDLSFIFAWAISPQILTAFTLGMARIKSITEGAFQQSIMEVGYALGGFAFFLVLILLIPGSVGVLALVKDWGKYNPNWRSHNGKDVPDRIGKGLGSKLKKEELASSLGILALDPPEPHENSVGNGDKFDPIPPADSADVGPSDLDPTPLVSPPASPGNSTNKNVDKHGENLPVGDATKKQEESDEDSFKSVIASVERGESSWRRVGGHKEIEGEDTFHIETGDEHERTVRDSLADAAKKAAPLVTAIDPATGAALSAAGEILDQTEKQKSEGEVFKIIPGSERPVDRSPSSSESSDDGGGTFAENKER